MKIFIAAIALFVFVSMSFGYSSGPPDGYVGLSNSCVACHGSFQLNSGSGTIALTGLPAAGYIAGQTYQVTLTASQQGQSRWGFELAPLLQSNTNRRGGTLAVTQATLTQLSSGSGTAPQYLKHTTAGTRGGTANGPVSWNFDWTAPVAGSGTVVFYVANNNSNNNRSTDGDYIYTRQFIVEEAPVNGVIENPVAAVSSYAMLSAYPNPFNPTTTVRVAMPVAGIAKVAVYDLMGREVANLFQGMLTANTHQFSFNGSNLTSGVYIVRATSKNINSEFKLVLMK